MYIQGQGKFRNLCLSEEKKLTIRIKSINYNKTSIAVKIDTKISKKSNIKKQTKKIYE